MKLQAPTPELLKRINVHKLEPPYMIYGHKDETVQAFARQAQDKIDELVEIKNAAYEERNRVVAAFARAAVTLGWKVGVTKTAIEGWSEDWHGCIYIETPAGQASWHFHDSQAHLFADLPRADIKWDGHSTPEKYERLHTMRLTGEKS